METWLHFLETRLNLEAEVVINLLITLVIFVALWLVRRGILQIAYRRSDDLKTRYNWRKVSGYSLFFLLAVFIIPLWVRNGVGLTTYLGLLSAGIAIALKDPLTNLAGWVFVIWRHPFRVGDRIQIGDHAGDVVDIRVFQFTLMEIGNWVAADQSTGRIIHVPNGSVFLSPLANYSRGFDFIWNEVPIYITFESDWEQAMSILGEIAEKHSATPQQTQPKKKDTEEEYLIFYKYLTPKVYTRVVERGVELTIRYLCKPRQRRGSEQVIWEDVLRAFDQHDEIRFAYPTYRYVGERRPPWQNDSL